MAPSAKPGIVLLAATALALALANSPLAASYHAFWDTPARWLDGLDVRFLVDDGLMTIFFFVVGLELRRELQQGALADRRRATLPVAAALGGMLVPAAVFLAFNLGGGGARGWGIPMATDIAFAVGVLALLGARLPPTLRVLLLALAVIDDLGAILVIALFYSADIHLVGLAVLAAAMGGILGMQRLGVRRAWAYALPAVVAWFGAHAAGIHPTLAGAAVGLATPAGPQPGGAPSPAERLEHALEGIVTYGIMPLFAFANAGVTIEGLSLGGSAWRVLVGVGIGLVAGKPLGILGGSALSVRLGAAALPEGMTFPEVAVMGCAGGIGFTMALFIAELAFPSGPLLEAAKLGVLGGSTAAALVALGLGRLHLRHPS